MFRELLSSSVWVGTPKHVKLVWVSLLLLKDQDGIVSASVPGLAKEAEVSIEECLDALARFHAPDPHSRTKDFEGRRIETVDGGWKILNHWKYRDKENTEERKKKDAQRAQDRRDRTKADESGRIRTDPDASGRTPPPPPSSGNVRKVRHTDTEADPDMVSVSGSGSEDLPSPEIPDHGGGGDRVHGSRAPEPNTPDVRTESPRRAPDPDPRATERRRLKRVLADEHARRFNALRTELGAKVPMMQLVGDPAERELSELINAQVSLEGFEDAARHAMDVREDEARNKIGSLKFFGASMWRPHNFATTKSMQVGEDRRAAPPARDPASGRAEPQPEGSYPSGKQKL